jgi:ABC-type lipoprotein export system ATPase subunit
LYFSYKSKQIFKSLSYNVVFKKLILIKGNTGSGKTTFLKLIAGLLSPDKGSVKLLNEQLEIHPYFVTSNPEFSFITGYIGDEIYLQSLKTNMNVEMFKGRHISEISGGQLKELSIVLAIHSNKRVLLIDEPFGMLDDYELERMAGLICEKSNTKAMIVVTHETILDGFAENIIYL